MVELPPPSCEGRAVQAQENLVALDALPSPSRPWRRTAWTMATLAVQDSALLVAVRPAAVLYIWEFNPQGLANTAWALATLAVEDSELLQAVRLAAVLHIWEFNPQGLASTT